MIPLPASPTPRRTKPRKLPRSGVYSLTQVAARFDRSYEAMRVHLHKHGHIAGVVPIRLGRNPVFPISLIEAALKGEPVAKGGD